MTAYKRVLLALRRGIRRGKVGLDLDVINSIAREVAEVVRGGVQVAIVVGGGNFFRGAELQQRGMERARADYMGMLGTVMNCLAPRTSSRSRASRPACRPRSPWARSPSPTSRAARSVTLEKGRVVIFGAGAGCRIHRHRRPARPRDRRRGPSWGKQDTDGVYDADPNVHADAVKFDALAYDEFVRGLKVADATSVSLSRDNDLRSCSTSPRRATSPESSRVEKIGTTVRAPSTSPPAAPPALLAAPGRTCPSPTSTKEQP